MKFLLSPFAFIYLILTEFRIFCFKIKLFKSYKIPIPVISVGNLSFGGTGKTPFTIELARSLRNDFKHILILSRGYKRKSKGALIVSLNGNILTDVKQSGDEAMLLAQKCVFASVVVAENRIDGYRLIEDKNPDLVILDDGYQHLKIERDCDILLTSGYKPFWKDNIFPMGHLREKRSNYRRADIICVSKKREVARLDKAVFYVAYKNYTFSKAIDHTKKYTLLTGIVDNKAILEFLSKQGIAINKCISLKDHAESKDFEKYLNLDNLIVTEKDIVKLDSNALAKVTILSVENELSDSLLTAIKHKIVI